MRARTSRLVCAGAGAVRRPALQRREEVEQQQVDGVAVPSGAREVLDVRQRADAKGPGRRAGRVGRRRGSHFRRPRPCATGRAWRAAQASPIRIAPASSAHTSAAGGNGMAGAAAPPLGARGALDRGTSGPRPPARPRCAGAAPMRSAAPSGSGLARGPGARPPADRRAVPRPPAIPPGTARARSPADCSEAPAARSTRLTGDGG